MELRYGGIGAPFQALHRLPGILPSNSVVKLAMSARAANDPINIPLRLVVKFGVWKRTGLFFGAKSVIA